MKKALFEFIQFAVVGTLGTITNLLLFYIFGLLGVHYMLNSCLCFVFAASQNYILNNFFTFNHKKITLKTYFLYLSSNIFGLLINLATLYIVRNFILENLLWRDLISQAIGIAFAMIFNFLVAKFIVFKDKK